MKKVPETPWKWQEEEKIADQEVRIAELEKQLADLRGQARGQKPENYPKPYNTQFLNPKRLNP